MEVSYEELKSYVNEQASVMSRFFEDLHGMTNTKLMVIISEGLRCNGRAVMTLPNTR